MGAFKIGKKIYFGIAKGNSSYIRSHRSRIKTGKRFELRLIAGILLIIAAVINLLARIDIGIRGWAIDGIITLVLFASGIILLKFDKWLPFGALALGCAILGIFYPMLKLYVYHSMLPQVLGLAPEECTAYFQVGLASFIPTTIISVIAAILILKWKFSKS